MGKGGRAKKQVEKVSESEPIEDQEEEIEDDEDSQMINDEDQQSNSQKLLKKIQDEIIGSEESIKLSWAAIHSLVQKEQKINEQMDQQMKKIQDKYDKLKQPIFQQIAKAASGEKLENNLYNQHQLTKSLNLSKFKPQKIPGFWVGVFQSIGFLTSELDKQIFEKCTKVKCTSKKDDDKDEQTISVEFTFDTNDFFSNKTLGFMVHRKQIAVDILEKSRVDLKKTLDDDSILTEIFDPNLEPFKVYEYASDVLRAHNQAIFFYFFESKIDNIIDRELEEAGDEDDDDDGGDEDDQQSDSQKEVGKPVKRRKTNNEKEGEKIQKPECNQQ